MEYNKNVSLRQKSIENLILLVLGVKHSRISVLHLQKEVFILWNFHPAIKDFLYFMKHYKGPFSTEIDRIIHHPFYLDECWLYEKPLKGDDLSGGYIILTDKGLREYKKIYDEAMKKESLRSLLTGIKMVRELYDQLSLEELLLLIYDTYPDYTEKSTVFQRINEKKSSIAKRLFSKGIIDEERYNSLIEGNICA